MRDQEQRALVGGERLFELLDRRKVQVVGRLVEDEHVDAARLQQREARAGALPRRQLVDGAVHVVGLQPELRSEEHTSELQSLMRISYAVFCLKKKKNTYTHNHSHIIH